MGKSSLRPDIHKTQVLLDSLEAGAVIVDRYGHAWQYGGGMGSGEAGYWYRAYDGEGTSSFFLAQAAESVTVLMKGSSR